MELTVGAGTYSVVFFECTSEVLTAVVAGLECNICNREGAVRQEKDSMFQALPVDVFRDCTLHIF